MKVDTVTSQYLRFSPIPNTVEGPQNAPEGTRATPGEKATRQDIPTGIESDLLPQSSNPKLASLLNEKERQTLASLFGDEGLAKLDVLIESGNGRLPEIPRGLLVNLQA